jgi:sulfur relay (sulfurtransferase) complex TusBCD TusD component (DsrE family)
MAMRRSAEAWLRQWPHYKEVSMARFVFVESRDPYACADCTRFLDLVAGVHRRSHEVTLFLVQNAVLSAREGASHAGGYSELARAGVAVVADAFALRERAVDRLASGVEPTGIDRLVSLALTPQTRVIWH